MQVGDLVKITRTGSRYPSYQDWADRYLEGKDIRGSDVLIGDVGIITARASHNLISPEVPGYEILYGFKRILDDKMFIMGGQGIDQANLRDVVKYLDRWRSHHADWRYC